MSHSNPLPPIVIVAIETAEIRSIESHISRLMKNPIKVFQCGNEALDYLVHLIATGAGPLPAILFAALKLEPMEGLDFVTRVRQHPELEPMKVFVWGDLKRPRLKEALRLGATGCFPTFFTREVLKKLLTPPGTE